MSYIKFLGTAGARFVMITQSRSSGGIWLSHKSTNVIIDPGPGAIAACARSRPRLDPTVLDGIILTHKHLDHSGDVNVMVEAMTSGGFKKRGVLFLPRDALGEDGVIFSYLRDFPEKITLLKEKGRYKVGDIGFAAATRNLHSVETYGLKFLLGDNIVSFVSDTGYFDDIIASYADSTVLVLNLVFTEPRHNYGHLSVPEGIDIVKKIKPPRAVFTHFGMNVLKQKPHILEKNLRDDLGIDIKFAYDGLRLELK